MEMGVNFQYLEDAKRHRSFYANRMNIINISTISKP